MSSQPQIEDQNIASQSNDVQDEMLLLLRESARGNQKAFQYLYSKTSGRMYAVALRIMRRKDLADEVMQEAYVKIWHNASEYLSDRGAVLTWMVSILRYRAIDRLRKLKREIHMEDADNYQDQLIDNSEDPLQYIHQAGESKVLHGCLEELVDKQKQSIALAFFDGLTHEQLSAHLDAPLGTVKSWVRRGLKLLRQCLDNEIQQARTH